MVNVQDVLGDVPHFETFCSVEKLHALVERLQADSRFAIETAGTSANGVPIHHVRFGRGSVKALLVAFPHCMEPIGSLTVFSLMSLLHQGNRTLVEADVEWHIVPCIDPDGAILNEGWSQKPFTFENYMRNYHLQAWRDQVDMSFPITYKKVVWDQPSREAKVLQGILDQIRPDFYFSLHNAWAGGAFYFLSRDIDHRYHRDIYDLLKQHGVPIQKRPIWREFCDQFGDGIIGTFSIRKFYDYLEKTMASPEQILQFGAHSRDYLLEIKPDAFVFTAEIGYVRHPDDESEKETGQNLRKFQLEIGVGSKVLAAAILEEWEKVRGEVDHASPFYRALVGDMGGMPEKEKLCEGGFPLSRFPERDILFNPQHDRMMTEGDRFQACMVDGGFMFLPLSYRFVRLLKASNQSPAVKQAIVRLEQAVGEALADIACKVDFDKFEVIDCDTLAKVQLGSGLIALNSVLEAHGRVAKTA